MPIIPLLFVDPYAPYKKVYLMRILLTICMHRGNDQDAILDLQGLLPNSSMVSSRSLLGANITP